MSENPYAQSSGRPDHSLSGQQAGMSASDLDLVEPKRTSVLAIASIVCSILCCIPGVGLLGALLGVGALFGISGSRGRVGGRGLAIAGLILGMLGTAVYIGFFFAMQAGIAQLGSYAEFLRKLERGDTAGAMADISPSSTVSETELLEWHAGFDAVHGSVVSTPEGIFEYIGSFAETTSVNPQLMATAQQSFPGGASIMPLPVEMDSGPATLLIVMDQFNVGPSGMPMIVDIGYDDLQGTLVWLVNEPLPMGPVIMTPPSSTPTGNTPPGSTPAEEPDADTDAASSEEPAPGSGSDPDPEAGVEGGGGG